MLQTYCDGLVHVQVCLLLALGDFYNQGLSFYLNTFCDYWTQGPFHKTLFISLVLLWLISNADKEKEQTNKLPYWSFKALDGNIGHLKIKNLKDKQ